MSLAAHQEAFTRQLWVTGDATGSESLGMQIYQNAYRERLLAVLEASYERTRQWVGGDAFTAAARHYVISYPPNSWTLDAYGAEFPTLLCELFARDGEVAELAWLEWHLQQAFAAPDLPSLSGADVARAGLQDADWELLRFSMAAGFAARPASHDTIGLWQSLRSGETADFVLKPADPGVLVVWRQGLTPNYRMISDDEFAALEYLVQGATFGEVAVRCGESRAAALGEWFAQWLGEGLFAEFSVARQRGPHAPPPGAGY